MSEEDEEDCHYVPLFRQGPKRVFRVVTLIRYAIIAVLSGFLAFGIFTEELPELLVEAEFTLDTADCRPPEGFAISVHNGSWKTAERVELTVQAERRHSDAQAVFYIWGLRIEEVLMPGDTWSGCLSPVFSSKSNRVIEKDPDAFTWEFDKLWAEFAD